MNTHCWVGMGFHFPGLIFIERNDVYYYRPQGKVMFSQASVSHSVHYQPHGYSVIAHPCYGAIGTHPTGILSSSMKAKLMLRYLRSELAKLVCSLTWKRGRIHEKWNMSRQFFHSRHHGEHRYLTMCALRRKIKYSQQKPPTLMNWLIFENT